jgi:adenine phosphoribosyltransferase
MDILELKHRIRAYKDFPKKGVLFQDISPVLADPEAFSFVIDSLVEQTKADSFNKILAIDARGFLFGGALAYRLGKSLILCRKPGKLPGELATVSYDYEYSSGSLSIQHDACGEGDHVLIVDDVLATGNTLRAAYQAVTDLGGQVSAVACVIELVSLHGRNMLEARSLLTY